MKLKFTAVMVLIMGCSLPVQAKMFKWVDENGQMHFGDSIPMQYRTGKHVELSEKGTLVKTHDAQDTEEQRLEKQRLELEQKEEMARLEEQEKMDRGLLDTYSSKEELVAARDSRLVAVDSQLTLSNAIITETKRKIDITGKQILKIKAAGNKVPKNILDKYMQEKEQIATYEKLATDQIAMKNKIGQEYGEYINRFTILTQSKKRD